MKQYQALPSDNLCTLILSCLLFFSSSVDAQQQAENIYWYAQGGRVYDNWMGLVGRKEQLKRQLNITDFLNGHPAYPEEGKQKGFTTWRCKECHGWDYRGVDGAYGKGGHFTGISGVLGMAGRPVADILTIIRNETHGYTKDMIDDQSANALALFISEGLIDMRQWISETGEVVQGDLENGRPHFEALCAICHGLKGQKINFNTSQKPRYLGEASRQNPWEVLHKIRNGHPGEQMINTRSLPIQSQIDILKFVQKLSQ
ncbi:MAG: hypothetical protein KZQ91_09765 [Candidatus Thiodiazotropha sp. (ex Lucinoma borealis)]|nr:hypothetical protein [Candidatus Thiodiazotropha sp. (ex Lucinoma borealis)]